MEKPKKIVFKKPNVKLQKHCNMGFQLDLKQNLIVKIFVSYIKAKQVSFAPNYNTQIVFWRLEDRFQVLKLRGQSFGARATHLGASDPPGQSDPPGLFPQCEVVRGATHLGRATHAEVSDPRINRGSKFRFERPVLFGIAPIGLQTGF